MKSSTERFSDRVENYVKHRPGYPEPMVRKLLELVPLPALVADLGSGTGILSRQLMKAGYEVFGVEPNGPMRAAAEQSIGANPSFHSISGTAEATTLAYHSIDLITAAQAFHWFQIEPAKAEFRRILKPGGIVAIIWNERAADYSDFDRRHEQILEDLAPEYSTVAHRRIDPGAIREFFAPCPMAVATFENSQRLSREGLIGRFLSSSYVPNVGEPGNQAIMEAAENLFEEFQVDGQVTMTYQTLLYTGKLQN
jgi:SAM-dependent methyltransferase